MDTIAILGSGFGLYGYLPALASSQVRIILPIRYRNKFLCRLELKQFLDYIIWVDNDYKALDLARGIVIAKRPIDQESLIRDLVSRQNIKFAILEKPIAMSPEISKELLFEMIKSGKKFRIGYLFEKTNWGKKLIELIDMNIENEININWVFRAHHIVYHINSWKAYHEQGGGALRFYGIQMIGLLSRMGVFNVLSSYCYGEYPNRITKWEASFISEDKLTVLNIMIDIDSKLCSSYFSITGKDGTVHCNLQTPFEPGENEQDYRVKPIRELFESFKSDYDYVAIYKRSIDLWLKIEELTNYNSDLHVR